MWVTIDLVFCKILLTHYGVILQLRHFQTKKGGLLWVFEYFWEFWGDTYYHSDSDDC
jgi:hypothetical protein